MTLIGYLIASAIVDENIDPVLVRVRGASQM